MANGHGGARPGAGRKKGSATARPSKRALTVMERAGVEPLEVMATACATFLEAAKVCTDPDIQAKHIHRAATWAKELAPYAHPRLAALDASVDQTVKHEDAFAAIEGLIDNAEIAHAAATVADGDTDDSTDREAASTRH